MDPDRRPATEVGERRRAPRRPHRGQVRLLVDGGSLEGPCDNLSQAGVLFFSDDVLRVTIEIEEDGQTRAIEGQLVRVERMSESRAGYAVEFDRP